MKTPEKQENFCDVEVEIYEEDSKITEIVNKLYDINSKNDLEVNELYELMEGGVESANEEKISQESEENIDDDLDELAEDKGSKDISFDVFRWFNNFFTKSPCIRYGRGILPLWYSDKDRPQIIPSLCSCGLLRTFECQILPQIIVKVPESNLDFGSIFVYTCPVSCDIQGYAVEQAFFQPSL